MNKSERLASRIDPKLKERLRSVCAERDVPEAQAIREGIKLWLVRESHRARAERRAMTQ
jgi:hypothetical protein